MHEQYIIYAELSTFYPHCNNGCSYKGNPRQKWPFLTVFNTIKKTLTNK